MIDIAEQIKNIDLTHLMTKRVTATSSFSLKEAADLMQQNNIRRLPVLDNEGKLVGIVNSKDILKSTLEIIKKVMVEQDFMTLAF